MAPESGCEPNAEAILLSYYLERATRELSQDLDKVRGAEDFKLDSVPFLVHALRQNVTQFSSKEQKRVVSHLAPTENDNIPSKASTNIHSPLSRCRQATLS